MSQKVVREVVREVRDRPPTVVHRREEEPPVVVPRRAPAPVVVAKPPLSAARQFDPSDLAPEDRLAHNGVARAPCNRWPQSTGRVGPFDPIVTGSFHILGVNYSRYENAKSAPRVLEKFHKAICEDVVSEVGCGITPNDVLLNIMPGAIDNVILHYHTESDGTHVPVKSPKLVDAVWRMKVDYCLVTRDVQRQQQAAMAMYTALNSGYNMAHKTATAYVKYLAEGSDVTSVRIVPGPGQGQQQAAPAPAAAPLAGRAPVPQRPNLPSPPRSTALDAHVRRHVPAPPQDAQQQQMQVPVQHDQGQQRHGGGGGGLVPPPLPKRSRSRIGEESPIRAGVHLLSPRVEEKIWAPYGDPPPYGCGAGASEAGYAAVAKQAAEAAVCHAAQAAAYSRGSPHGLAYATPQQQQQQQGQAVAVAAAAAASASAAASATVCSGGGGGGSGTPMGYSAEVLKDMRKDKELELLESEIRKERQAIQSSLQSASTHRTYRQV